MSVGRCEQWPTVLDAFVAERSGAGFDWVRNNCAFFASDWVARLTGIDPAAGYRDGVTSALSAARALAALAPAGGLAEALTAALARWDWPECPPAFARRGDLVSCESGTGPALGLCLGARSAFVGPAGLVYIQTLNARRAWRIA